jgi:hypothetical protein
MKDIKIGVLPGVKQWTKSDFLPFVGVNGHDPLNKGMLCLDRDREVFL